mmetsp:Transcript_3610/g.6018  ORF Transcript_3610/g.6018 Transcript_3610/m.6018 type:complete len:90 (-) Transcript_3610:1056-1325(-)
MRMPPKIPLIPISKLPNPWAVWLSGKTAMNPWPRNVNTAKDRNMNNQYKKNFPAFIANPTVKYHKTTNTIDARMRKGISTSVNASPIAL